MKKYAVIMAGGKGERFWPWSRGRLPKQFLNLMGESTLIQQTYERLAGLFGPEEILVVTAESFVSLVRNDLPQIPPENIIAEPAGRNTAPCIGLSALRICRENPEALMLVTPSDHMVINKKSFHLCLEKCMELAFEKDLLVTIGITPTRPETGYGYIKKKGEPLTGEPQAFGVEKFVEKPDLPTAFHFLNSGNYFWNSGIFVWKAGVILEKIREHLPELYHCLQDIDSSLGTDEEAETISRLYSALPSVSIDYGIMEKEKDILVVQGDFGWDDLGSWVTLAEHFQKDQDQNVIKGKHIGMETSGCIVYGGDALIATLGVTDLVIVQSDDVVMVCSKDRTQEIKDLVNMSREKGLIKYL